MLKPYLILLVGLTVFEARIIYAYEVLAHDPARQLQGCSGVVALTSRRLLNRLMRAEVFRLSSSQSGQSLGEKKSSVVAAF